MSSKESFYSVEAEASAELNVKSSRFIAHVAPAASREIAEEYVAKISKLYHDATHNCYAYKIGVGDESIFRYYDAGEPSGTAGRPIFQAIEAKKLTNVVVVVTRYFGGTKLGTGGLIRAYHAAALAALDQASIIKQYPQLLLGLDFSYPLTHAIHQILAKFNAQVIESRFDEVVHYLIQFKALDETNFTHELNNITGGKINIYLCE
jgi:uncharacterized YigZ family protein